MAASPELQRKIEVLYRSALEVDPPKRASFLDRACAGDDLLRQGIESLHYIVTEFIDGMTLRRYLSEHQIGIREMLDVATQIAGALSAAHAFGVVHRDIKPENIMRRQDGYVKVLDFGLAKLVPTQHQEVDESTQSTALNINTDPGSIIGTVAYMSPEQLRGLKVDGRA